MNLASIKNATSRGAAKTLFNAKHYSPEILTVVGIAGVVTAAVLAARATLKLEETVDKGQARLNLAAGDPDDVRKAQIRAYSQNVFDIVKLYGPSLTLGGAAIFCIYSAQGIMRKRNAALAVAYKTLETAYTNYRARVVEEFGEEKDKDFHLGLKSEVVTNPETGKEETVKSLYDPNLRSPYARFFVPENQNWSGVPDQNFFFIKSQQNYWNQILQSRGYVFLNEVYKNLGIALSPAGQNVGWILSDEGDNYIDFDIFSVRNSDFIEGNEKSVLLDFNVDGFITDKVKFDPWDR